MKDKQFDKQFRAHGYMTVDEFINKLTPGLRYYLLHNWTKDETSLHHPEDLASNALVYMEVAFSVIGQFGAAPHEKY